MPSRIAVLLTCFNRREKTLACLRALFCQDLPAGVSISVFLVDDGCSDGTGAAVREVFPSVTVLQGDGTLFWVGGMRLAFGEAMKHGFEYYIWLNDDTYLYKDAIAKLLATNVAIGPGYTDRAVICGSTADPRDGHLTYGGLERANIWHPLNLRIITPDDVPQQCLTINGNCVLIPSAVAKVVGNLGAEFCHTLGDVDYGRRTGRLGFSCWTAPGFVGTCENDHPPRSRFRRLSLRERWNKMTGPSVHPPRAWAAYCRRYAGLLWPLFWCRPYIKDLIVLFAPGGALFDSKSRRRRGTDAPHRTPTSQPG